MADTDDSTARLSTSEQVARAIQECREFGKAATRQSISQMTNLPVSIVDDRVKYLRSIGRVRLAGGNVAGVYEPAEDPMDDRAVSCTILPNGRVKLELGDKIVEMTQREASHVGALLHGITVQYRGA